MIVISVEGLESSSPLSFKKLWIALPSAITVTAILVIRKLTDTFPPPLRITIRKPVRQQR